MTEITDHLSALLHLEAALDVWDLPPSLALLTRTAAGEVSTIPVTFPADMWVGTPTHLALDVIAAAVIQGHPLPIGKDAPDNDAVIGVMFFAETWSLNLTGITGQDMDQLEEWAAGNLAFHPRAVETKNLTAVMLSGDRCALTATRRTGQVDVFEGAAVTGSLVDGLVAILTAVALTT